MFPAELRASRMVCLNSWLFSFIFSLFRSWFSLSIRPLKIRETGSYNCDLHTYYKMFYVTILILGTHLAAAFASSLFISFSCRILSWYSAVSLLICSCCLVDSSCLFRIASLFARSFSEHEDNSVNHPSTKATRSMFHYDIIKHFS